MGRRDLRRGQQTGSAQREGSRVIVSLQWGPEAAGTGREEYWLDYAGRLCVHSEVTVAGRSAATTIVYERQASAGDARYYSKKEAVPFGIDANKLSSDMLIRFR